MAFTLSTKPKEFVPEWNGNRESDQPITMILGRLTVGDFWELAPLGQKIGKIVLNFSETNPKQISELLEKIKPLFIKYVSGLENLWIEEKKAMPSDVAEHIEFAPIMMEIISELISRAQITDKKKSLTPSLLKDEMPISQDGSNSIPFATTGHPIGKQ